MRKDMALSLSLLAIASLIAGAPLSIAQNSNAQTQPPVSERALVPANGGTVRGTLHTSNAVNKLPRVDVRHPDFGASAGCANPADPTGQADSTCAINAAVNYALSTSQSGEYPALYIPLGTYKLTAPIRLPCYLHAVGDGATASALKQTTPNANVVTVYPARMPVPPTDGYLCSGSIEGITLTGSGHTSTGTLLELISSSGFSLRGVVLYNTGGRGLSLQGSSERLDSNDLSIDAVRWPLVLTMDTNEDHFFKTNISNPGATADNYCFSVNCVNGQYPGPNQGPGGSATPMRPDIHSAVWMNGVDIGFYGGSFKALQFAGGIQAVYAEASIVSNVYFEGYQVKGQPRLNAAVTLGGILPSTTLAAGLNSSGMVASVTDTSWFPTYVNDPGDMQYLNACLEQEWIMPKDFEWGNTSPSAFAPGVLRNQYEEVCSKGMAGDGKMYIFARNQKDSGIASTAPANTSWPAGSIVHMVTRQAAYGGGLTLLSNHIDPIAPPGAGYSANCNDANEQTCASIIAGFIPDGYFLNPPGSRAGALYIGPPQLTMINNSMYGVPSPKNELVGEGYVKVHMGARITVEAQAANIPGKSATSDVLQGQGTTGASALPVVMAVQYPTGASAALIYTRPDAGLFQNTYTQAFEQALTAQDAANLGTNPGSKSGANGHQFASSDCWYDIGPSQTSTHALNRFCMKGGPSLTGSSAGWEYDVWDGKQWANAFQLKAASDGTADYIATGNGVLGSPGKTLVINASKLQINATSVTGLSGGGRSAPASYVVPSSAPRLPAKVCGTSVEGQTAAIPSTDICDVPATGGYQVIVNVYPTARARTTAGSVAALVSCSSVAGNPTVGGNNQLNLADPDASAGQAYFMHCVAGAPLSYATRVNGLAGGAEYGLDISVIRVQ